MKILFCIMTLLIVMAACEKQTTGYLEAEDAVYDPDSLVIRKVLDATLDADRIKRQYPWVSPPMQGVLGTYPFSYEIAGVHSTDGDVNSFLQAVKLRGDSSFEIPLEGNVAPGKYVIDISISNRGGITCRKDGIFRIIVK